jgi:hypothetical protein
MTLLPVSSPSAELAGSLGCMFVMAAGSIDGLRE